MKKKEKNNKGVFKLLVVLFLILILVFLAYLGYQKFINVPEKTNVTNNIPDSKELIEGNVFSLGPITCLNKTDTVCEKELKVSYNNANHLVKIKRIINVNGDTTNIKNEIYVDNIVVDTLDGGTIYDSYRKIDVDFDGYIYIVEGKYLALVLPFVVDKQINYVVNYYNERSALGKGIDIINGEQTICLHSCSEKENILNNLDGLEFNGKILKYWKALCENRNVEALQIGITVENNKVTTKYLNTESDVEIKGACN